MSMIYLGEPAVIGKPIRSGRRADCWECDFHNGEVGCRRPDLYKRCSTILNIDGCSDLLILKFLKERRDE